MESNNSHPSYKMNSISYEIIVPKRGVLLMTSLVKWAGACTKISMNRKLLYITQIIAILYYHINNFHGEQLMTFTRAWAQSSVMLNVICWSFLNIYNCKIAKDLINDLT